MENIARSKNAFKEWEFKKEGRKIKADTTTLTINTTGQYNKTPKKVGKVTANILNVRSGPGTGYSNLAAYPKLSLNNMIDICDLTLDSNKNQWYYIRIANKYYGFVSAAYI